MTSHRFPRTARVRARCDFDRVFKAGRRVGQPVLALHWHRTGTEPGARLGLAVSRKVDPHAVGRNRIKRCLREAFRHLRADLAPGDYVVVARPGAAAHGADALTSVFRDLLRRAGAFARALPAEAPAGTLPPASPTPPADAPPAPPAEPACP